MVRQLVLNKNGLNLNEIQVEKYNNWFKNYCDSFTDLSGEQRRNFKLKKVHTREVKKNCRLIADTLDLRPIFVKVAEVIGIFHDIGRFEQIKRFNSFSD